MSKEEWGSVGRLPSCVGLDSLQPRAMFVQSDARPCGVVFSALASVALDFIPQESDAKHLVFALEIFNHKLRYPLCFRLFPPPRNNGNIVSYLPNGMWNKAAESSPGPQQRILLRRRHIYIRPQCSIARLERSGRTLLTVNHRAGRSASLDLQEVSLLTPDS